MRLVAERFKQRLRHAVGVGGEPHRLAAAWALGVAVALSPFLGLHTLLALLLAFALRLNKLDVLLGTLLINPWTLPIYFPVALVLGTRLTGVIIPELAIPKPEALLSMAMWREQAAWLKPVLIAWGAGALPLSLLGGLCTYAIVLWLIQVHRRHHEAHHPS